MPTKLELIGKRFGSLVVIGEAERNSSGKIRYLCRCDCGNTRKVIASLLNTERVTSCGCMPPPIKQKATQMWADMVARCCNETHPSYKYYGGKGITVCSDWLDFQKFYAWALQNDINEESSIDRIDSDKGYTPSNCRFISLRENQLRGFETSFKNSRKSGRFVTASVAKKIRRDYYELGENNIKLLARKYGKCNQTIRNVLQNLFSYDED